MSNAIDITGMRFGKCVALKRIGSNKRGEALWECKCDCGNLFVTVCGKLRGGHTKSCGCLLKDSVKMHMDLTNERFGRLLVVEHIELKDRDTPEKAWKCKCDCGKFKNLSTSNLLSGNVVSCGCYSSESSRKRAKEMFSTHGMSDERLYAVWCSMKARCYNKNNQAYHNYGGRGIKVCEEWRNNFQTFYDWAMENGYDKDAKKWKCTLDRIDVNRNYEPPNCRWVSQKIQANNTRTNHYIEYKGETRTLKEWSEIIGINYKTIQSRLHYGWDVERIFETKYDARKKGMP